MGSLLFHGEVKPSFSKGGLRWNFVTLLQKYSGENIFESSQSLGDCEEQETIILG